MSGMYKLTPQQAAVVYEAVLGGATFRATANICREHKAFKGVEIMESASYDGKELQEACDEFFGWEYGTCNERAGETWEAAERRREMKPKSSEVWIITQTNGEAHEVLSVHTDFIKASIAWLKVIRSIDKKIIDSIILDWIACVYDGETLYTRKRYFVD
jgi:hypothetical protein